MKKLSIISAAILGVASLALTANAFAARGVDEEQVGGAKHEQSQKMSGHHSIRHGHHFKHHLKHHNKRGPRDEDHGKSGNR